MDGSQNIQFFYGCLRFQADKETFHHFGSNKDSVNLGCEFPESPRMLARHHLIGKMMVMLGC